MIPGQNDLCWCGSRRKYKHCHYKIDAATDVEKYSASQAVYAQNWRSTSETHYKAGVYEWLAEELKSFQPRRILDIGPGSGHGLVSLLKILGDDIKIVAVDENKECLHIAQNTLKRMSFVETELVKRMAVTITSGGFSHTAEPLVASFSKQATLIESGFVQRCLPCGCLAQVRPLRCGDGLDERCPYASTSEYKCSCSRRPQ